jgi:5-methylthioadenosine/S-adenosylhomocysteine deaminase
MSMTLIKNGLVLPLDEAAGPFDRSYPADVLIDGTRISAIKPNLNVPDADVIDAADCLVMPGFVDTHRHVWQTQLRAICGDWSLKEYMRGIRFQRGKIYRPEDVYVGNYAGMLEALNAGVTTVCDFSHCINSPEHADAAVRGLRDSGGRAMFGYGFNDVPLDKPYFKGLTPRIELLRRLRKEQFSSANGPVTLGVSLSDMMVGGREQARAEVEAARELGCRMTIHTNCFKSPDAFSEIEVLREHNLMGPDLLFVHVNQATDDELKAVVDSGGSISATPETEMQMGMGHPVTGRFIAAGGKPTFGADIISGGSGDLFFHMRLGLQAQRMLDNDSVLATGFSPETIALSTRTALKAATVWGAEAMGLGSQIGTLTVGKQADLILVRLDDINTMPVNDQVATVVMHAHPGNVDSVLVAGKVLKRKGRLTAEMARVRLMVRESHEQLLAALAEVQATIPSTYRFKN